MKKFLKLKIVRKLGALPLLTEKKSKRKSKFNDKDNLFNSNIISSISNDFKDRLIEKQKLKFNFALTEKQLYNYVLNIRRKKYFNKISLIELISLRLDCILFYSGIAKTILEARQFISHKHILLNNKYITISGNLCKIGDIISISDNTKINEKIIININNKNNLYENNFELDKNNLNIKFINAIKKENMLFNIDESKIFEYY